MKKLGPSKIQRYFTRFTNGFIYSGHHGYSEVTSCLKLLNQSVLHAEHAQMHALRPLSPSVMSQSSTPAFAQSAELASTSAPLALSSDRNATPTCSNLLRTLLLLIPSDYSRDLMAQILSVQYILLRILGDQGCCRFLHAFPVVEDHGVT